MTQGNDAVSTINALVSGGGVVATESCGDVTVRVCSAKELPMVIQFLSKVSKDLELRLNDPRTIEEKLLSKLDDVGYLLQLIANYSTDIYGILASITSLKTVEAVESLPVDDLALLVLRAVEVNRDFFTKRVLPLVERALTVGA